MSLDNVSGNNNDKRQPKNVGNNIPKSDFASNKKMQKLFDFFNTSGNDDVLDNDEVLNLWDRVAVYADIDKNSVFSKEEAQTLLDESGININAEAGEEISVGDLFGFLKNVANKNTGAAEDDVTDTESTQATSNTGAVDNVEAPAVQSARTTVTNSFGQSFTLEEFSEQEVKNLTVDAFNADVEKANQIYNSQRKNEGLLSEAVNGINEAFDTDLARSKVGRMLMYQNARNRWLQRANDGNLTEREYLESKIDLLARCILANIDDGSILKNIVKLASNISPASKLFTNYLKSGETKTGEKEAAEAELSALKSLLANLETSESLDVLISNAMEGDYFDNLSAGNADIDNPIGTIQQILPGLQGSVSMKTGSNPVFTKGKDKIKLVFDTNGKARWELNGNKIDELIFDKDYNIINDNLPAQVRCECPIKYSADSIDFNLLKAHGFKKGDEQLEVYEFTPAKNNISSLVSDKLKTFEETFRDEFHIEYNEENMLDYIQKNATLNFMVAANNRDVEINNLLSSSIRQLQPFTTYKDKSLEYFNGNSNKASQMQMDTYEAVQKARNPYAGQEKLYDKGSPVDINGSMSREAARSDLQGNIINTIIGLYGNSAIQQGLDSLGIKGLRCVINGDNAELEINGKKCSNEDLIDIASQIINNTHKNYQKTLNGKTLEQYSNETKSAYNRAFVAPESDRTSFIPANAISELASDYSEAIQHGVGAIHTVTNTVGMVLAIGGQVIPGGQVLSPIGIAITTFGSPLLNLAEHGSSQNGLTQDQWGEIKDELAQNVLLTASGFGIGKVSGSAYKVMTLGQKVSTCRKLLAWGAEVGIDASMSLCADMAITGQIDFTGEGIAQLQSIIVGLCHAKGNFKGYLDTHAGSNPTSNDTQSQAVRPQGSSGEAQSGQTPASSQPKVRSHQSQQSQHKTQNQSTPIPRQDVTIDGQKINIAARKKYTRPDMGTTSFELKDDLMSSATSRNTGTSYESYQTRLSAKNDSRVREMCTDKNGRINSEAEKLIEASYTESLDKYYSTRINAQDSRRMDMETLLNSCRKENGEFDNDLLACARQLLESVPLNCDKDAFSPRDFELLLKNMQKAQSGTRQDMLSASKKLLETGITPYEAGSIISYCCGANIYGDIYNTNFSFDQKAFDKIYELAKNMPESGRRSYTLKLKYLVQNSMIYCGKSGENHIYRFYDENFEKLKMYYFDADYRHDANIPKSSDGTIDLDDFSSNTRNELNEILEKRIRERYGTEADDLIAKCQGSTEKMWDLSQGKKPEVLTTEQEMRLRQLATDANGKFNRDAFELAIILKDFCKDLTFNTGDYNYKDIAYYLKMCNGNYKEFAEIVSQIKNNLNKNGLKLDGPYITIDKAKNSKIPYDWYLRYGDMNQVLEYRAIHLDYLLDFYCLGRGKYMDYLKNNDFMDNLYYANRIRGFIRNAKQSNLTDSEDKLTEYIIETIRDKKPTPEEHSAIADYKGDNSEDMNTGRTAYWQQQAGYLESYINNHTLNFDNGLQVIRHDGSYECLNKITFADGTPLSEVLKNPAKYKDKLSESSLQTLSGQSYINERFVSTTADAGGVFPHNPIKWELTLGSGTQAAIIDIPLAKGEIECEFLINRNSKFTIESIDAGGIPITIKATVTTP